jgi:protein-S-isoprenylcysteine O-methyltransferase Ste14
MTVVKSVLFLLLVPGILLGLLPYWISKTEVSFFDPGFLRYLAIPLWMIGAGIMVWCFRDFTIEGHGTPAPIDPPHELIASGLYRYVRNPMYVAGLITLAGWILWSPSPTMIVTTFLFFIATHLFVIFYEEPTLKRKFGSGYEQYLKSVPRWIPRRPKQGV